MSFTDISRDAYTLDRGSSNRKYDLDIGTLRIQLKVANEAAKILYKEQKNIQRKREKTKSKELPKCMTKYDENLDIVNDAFERIGPILSENIEDSVHKHKKNARSSSWNVPKKKKRSKIDETCFQCHSKENNIKALQDEIQRIKRNSEDSIRQLTESMDTIQTQLASLQKKYQEEVRMKEDALRRLSKAASAKLRDNNPNITDLSDQNRPTKIAEKLSELYDNQWTDAFDFLEREMDEKGIIQTLLDTLMTAYDTCCKLSSKNFFERVQQSMELPAGIPEIPRYEVVLTDQQKQEIKEFRKTRATYVLRDVEKVVRPRLQIANDGSEKIQAYVSLCVEIGWLCAVQDPPVILDAKATEKFDTNKFKDYTTRGKYVEFVVWPAMFLHNEGPLLSKGVAQGYDQIKSHKEFDSTSRPTRSNNQPGPYLSEVPDGRFSNQPRKQHENYPRAQQGYTQRNQTYVSEYNQSRTMYAPPRNQGYGYYDQDHWGVNQYNQFDYNKQKTPHESRSKQHQGYNQSNQPDVRKNYNKSQTMYPTQRTNATTEFSQRQRNDIRSTDI